MRKGITPVIAIIVLLFITIALAGAAWTYMQGFMFGQITKTFNIPPNGIYCQGGIITIIAQNTGYQTTLNRTDFIVAKVGDYPIPDADFKNLPLDPGKGDVIIETNCGAACSSGSHTVNLATSSTVQRLTVTCP